MKWLRVGDTRPMRNQGKLTYITNVFQLLQAKEGCRFNIRDHIYSVGIKINGEAK